MEHSFSSSVTMEEEVHHSEELISQLLDEIFKSNQDQALIAGLDILLTLIHNIFKDPRKE